MNAIIGINYLRCNGIKLLRIATRISYAMNSFTEVMQLNVRSATKFGNKLIGMDC
jgi:hypothetical protein